MMIKTIFSGFGGQGVLMMGISLAHSAMNKGYHVTYLPAYGAEMRGGTANCTVAVSDEEIASPVASEPDYLVVMNSPSLFTFQNKVTPGGTIFINSSIIDARPSRQDVKTILHSLRRYGSGTRQQPRRQYHHDGRIHQENQALFLRKFISKVWKPLWAAEKKPLRKLTAKPLPPDLITLRIK